MDIIDKRIAIVGVGPGSLDYLTPIGRDRIEGSGLLVGSQRLLDLFVEHGGRRVSLAAGVVRALDAIAEARPDRVAVLVSGDPGLMSLSKAVIARFGRAECEVIAGVSALQVAFARLGRSWHDARVVDAHGRAPAFAPESLRDESKIAVLTGSKDAAQWLFDLGSMLERTHEIHALRNLTLHDETIQIVQPPQLEQLAHAAHTIVILLRKEPRP